MQSVFEFALNVAIAGSLGITAVLAVISGIHLHDGRSAPAQLVRWTITTLYAVIVGLAFILLAMAIDAARGVTHTGESLKLIGVMAGLAVLIIAWITQRPSETPNASPPPRAIQSEPAEARDRHEMPDAEIHLPAIPMRTALDDAHGVRNPISAWTHHIATNARIAALADAARLATATAKTAEAETAGLDSILKRDEKFAEYHARQQFRADLSASKLDDQQEIVRHATHQRELAAKRRDKEKLDAERERLSAKHGVEAAKKFKTQKFLLGEKRAQARIADAAVDHATANAAVDQLGGSPDAAAVASPKLAIDITMNELRRRIVEGEASGKDTTGLRTALQSIEAELAS